MSMKKITVIGSRIILRRQTLGMNQRELAEEIGITPSGLSRIEREQTDPAPKTFLSLVKALKTTPDYLIGKTDQAAIAMPNNLSRFDHSTQRHRVQVLGRISAGGDGAIAIAAEDVIDVIETDKQADFALRVCGDSMQPRLFDGDIVLVRKTPLESLRNGQMIVVICNGEEGLVKRIYFDTNSGIVLRSDNPEYGFIFVQKERIGVDCFIVGKVVEIRADPEAYGGAK